MSLEDSNLIKKYLISGTELDTGSTPSNNLVYTKT